MRNELLLAPAATITAALLQRMPASEVNNLVSMDEVGSLFRDVLATLQKETSRGRSFWEAGEDSNP